MKRSKVHQVRNGPRFVATAENIVAAPNGNVYYFLNDMFLSSFV